MLGKFIAEQVMQEKGIQMKRAYQLMLCHGETMAWSTFKNYVRGKTQPEMAFVHKLALVLNVAPEDLFESLE